jgi:hypothetical protein
VSYWWAAVTGCSHLILLLLVFTVGAAAALCFVSLAFGVRMRRDVAVTGYMDLR